MLGCGCHKAVREDKVKWAHNVSSELDSRRVKLRDKLPNHDLVIVHVFCLKFSVVFLEQSQSKIERYIRNFRQ